MTKDQLYEQLNDVNATRDKRLAYANMVLNDPQAFKPLMEIVFMVNDQISTKAAWVFEFVCDKNLELLIPYLDYFTQNISKVHLDSAVRPVAKVCKFIVEKNYAKGDHLIKSHLNKAHKEAITETCFSWLIDDEKVAPKVYAMVCLALLGNEFDWIHPELLMILEKDYHHQSAGFKAKARHIMKALKK